MYGSVNCTVRNILGSLPINGKSACGCIMINISVMVFECI